MKVLVVSDTHGKIENVTYLVEQLKEHGLAAIIHCGDNLKDAIRLGKMYPEIGVHMVPGNCDFSTEGYDRTQIVTIGGVTIFFTHGDGHDVKWEGYGDIYVDTCSVGAQLGICGHTHMPYLEKKHNVYLLNPGSVSLPRDSYYPSYAIVDIEGEKIKNVAMMQIVGKGQVARNPRF